jgi:hypothetical protein
MEISQEQYVVNTKGKKLSVILSLERYGRLKSHHLTAMATCVGKKSQAT